MWRPDGWENPNYNGMEGWPYTFDAYEAGADAILKAQGESPYSEPVKKHESIYTPSMIVAGTWVFIPDDGGLTKP